MIDGPHPWTIRQQVLIVAPPILVTMMFLTFRGMTEKLGFPLGYFLAFVIYWIGWCVGLPLVVLGPRAVQQLLARRGPKLIVIDLKTHVLLWWPITFPLLFAFVPRIGSASAAIIVLSIMLGTVTGITEELFWRGAYLRLFPKDVTFNSIYPSVWFGIWHLCPLAVTASRYPGGAVAFVAYATVLGLSYAACARRTGSIRWPMLSHCLHDVLGLGGAVYTRWLTS